MNLGSAAKFAPPVRRSLPANPPNVSLLDVPLINSELVVPCVPPLVTVTFAANSDVLPKVKSLGRTVAVAVTRSPVAMNRFCRNSVNDALPELSVVTFMKPRYVGPSPLVVSCVPLGIEKNSMRKLVLASEFSEPAMVVPVGPDTALEMTGKFCNPLAPVSASSESLA